MTRMCSSCRDSFHCTPREGSSASSLRNAERTSWTGTSRGNSTRALSSGALRGLGAGSHWPRAWPGKQSASPVTATSCPACASRSAENRLPL